MKFLNVWLFVFVFCVTACANPNVKTQAESPRAQAEQTIQSVLKRRGEDVVALPASNAIQTGRLFYRFDPETEAIIVSVRVKEFLAWTLFPDRRPKLEKFVSALSDPEIGGLFDTGGAEWAFDRDTGILYLEIAHGNSARPADLLASVDRLGEVFPEWNMNWIGVVGDIVHEGAPVPTRPVTLTDNPYEGYAFGGSSE